MKSNFLAYIISFTLLDLLHSTLAQTVVGIEWDDVPLADGGCEIDVDDEEQFCYSKIKTFLGTAVSFTEASAASTQTYQIIGNVDAAGEEIDEESWSLENCAAAEKELVTGGTLELSKKGGNYFALYDGTSCLKLHKIIVKPKKFEKAKDKKGTICDGTSMVSATDKGGCPRKCKFTPGCIGMQITRGKNKSCTLFSEVFGETTDGTKKDICRLVKNAAGVAMGSSKSAPGTPDTPGEPEETSDSDIDGESESEDGESEDGESESEDGESESEDGESESEDGESEESVDGESEDGE